MRSLLIIAPGNHLVSGGAETFVRRLCATMRDHGAFARWVSRFMSLKEPGSSAADTGWLEYNQLLPASAAEQAAKELQFYERRRAFPSPDLLVTFGAAASQIAEHLPRPLSHARRIVFFETPHDRQPRWQANEAVLRECNGILSLGARTWSISSTHQLVLARVGISNRRIDRILPWRVGRSSRPLPLHARGKTIVVPTRVAPRKGTFELITSLGAHCDLLRDWRTIITGGVAARYRHYSRVVGQAHQGLAGRVRIAIPPQPFPRLVLRHLFATSRLAVIPSHGELLGLAAIEAVACGALPIVPDISGLVEAIDGGRHGIVAPYTDDLSALGEWAAHLAHETGRSRALSRLADRLATSYSAGGRHGFGASVERSLRCG
ncbi:MAG: glycosyltransferase family 4 protein [Candidatus Eisenbacteria bacterium]|nr:glycosyltransferase family 4 protein [Candidatus Eisenbacteria bacterium]